MRKRTFSGFRTRVVLTFLAGGVFCAATHISAQELQDSLQRLIEADWVEQDRQFMHGEPRASAQVDESTPVNEVGVTSVQDAAGGCDGIKNGRCGFHTASNEEDAWWQVDLGAAHVLDHIVVYNRTDNGSAVRTQKLRILVATKKKPAPASRESERWVFSEVYRHTGPPFLGVNEKAPLIVPLQGKNIQARVVRLMVPGTCSFALDEVEVYGTEEPKTNLALHRPADQKSVGPYSFPGTKGEGYTPAKSYAPKESFSLEHSRAILDRTEQLARRLMADARRSHDKEAHSRLDALDKRRVRLAKKLARQEKSAKPTLAARKALYLECRQLLRRTAFFNPKLDFEHLLFLKRHDPGGLFHMCHQYYGFTAVPGGGLFVLSDPFGANPRVRNLLEESTVKNGRMAGRELVPGSFLSPDLSFDGRSILFAYTGAKGEYPEWSPRSSYHIFKVNVDGSNLTQLTDGKWNDFDPCFLPGGRIAFISGRRGGYLRCGGSSPPLDSPTYTLHSMAADGSDIICLSYHETHEWHPSVNNAGMLVYTRWDYVDRGTNVAHHIWTCYPDGRDPRAFHGNYPAVRESRPWMEMSIRAIPNSHRYVATAAAHHGHAFGSLVLIDPRLEDDGAMSQVTRLTPEVPFPEAEVHIKPIADCMVYGTPWPLSGDDFLCVYGADCTNRGIYWIDRFGNRELLYRDPDVSCLSPIPLRPRTAPPALPEGTTQVAGQEQRPARVAVMDVYNSDFDWPKDTKITALRIIQVLPKTTPPSNKPRIGIATQTNARAVLGTVPVEADGSVHFQAPVGKLIYFQALDEDGLAVQSMRSATYVHPGEQLTCLGCHESKHESPAANAGPKRSPLALRRAPSPIAPDVAGANPFSYARLVQPALDRNCVECHQKEKALDLSGTVEGKFGWSRSYTNLAKDYGFFYDAGKGSIRSKEHGGSRTPAGGFGARASALLSYLKEQHCKSALSKEDFHRFALWLDCNSEFYGAYEGTEAQARGEVVWPSLD